MPLKFLLFIAAITMIGCKTTKVSVDYFGQTAPKTTPVVFGKGLISKKGRFEHGISFSPDAQEVAFGILDKQAIKGNIYYSKKTAGTWSTPIGFKPLENKNVYLPYFSPDGKSLLYAQSIPDTTSLYITNIWKLEKNNDSWNSPKKIYAPLSSTSREANASMTNDGTIYFSSNRNCQGKENCYTADLFYSKLTANSYTDVHEIAELNSANDEESVFISPKETYILFCRYTDKETNADLYISYRTLDGHWTAPQMLDATINSKHWDRRPFVSIDNKLLFFTRLEIKAFKLLESDIYWVHTAKVFKPFVFNPLANVTVPIDKKFEITIPSDYFKDIDAKKLTLSINQHAFDWLQFDSKKRKLSGLPLTEGDFELIFTAVDEFSNKTEDTVKITVTR